MTDQKKKNKKVIETIQKEGREKRQDQGEQKKS